MVKSPPKVNVEIFSESASKVDQQTIPSQEIPYAQTGMSAPIQARDARGILYDYIRFPEFKRLLNQLVVAQGKRGFKSITVISHFAGEGKTLLVAALALGYSEFLRKKVLIIDTVSPTRNESFYFGRLIGDDWTAAYDASGIDLLTARALQRQIQYNQQYLEHKANGNLSVPRGMPPMRSPDSSTTDFQIGGLLRSIESQYDVILLDTCAMTAASKENIDPIILAKQGDATVLVSSYASLERQTMRVIRKNLRAASIELLGSVFNPGAKL